MSDTIENTATIIPETTDTTTPPVEPPVEPVVEPVVEEPVVAAPTTEEPVVARVINSTNGFVHLVDNAMAKIAYKALTQLNDTVWVADTDNGQILIPSSAFENFTPITTTTPGAADVSDTFAKTLL